MWGCAHACAEAYEYEFVPVAAHMCRDAFTALKLCCWLNTVEKREFSAPYEIKDGQAK